ncbi:MAG: HPr(Ser) kinase/phosphatase [Chlamydiota bacterium]
MSDFYKQHGESLGLELLSNEKHLKRGIRKAEVQRPGLSLAGYLKNFNSLRVLIFGRVEMEYLKESSAELRFSRLQAILSTSTPAVIIARGYRPLKELKSLCDQNQIPLFRSSLKAMELMSRVIVILDQELAATEMLQVTLVEVFGVGVLIQGKSSVGKSEAALGLLERGHRLVSDDVVKVKKKEGNTLFGFGPDLSRHIMEIRGIGIINVAHIYGAVCVRPTISIDLVVKLEPWDDHHFYDRVGLEEKFCEILEVNVPFHILPVKQGRDVVLLLETISLNHRLKEMGYNSAREFNAKLLDTIQNQRKRKRPS